VTRFTALYDACVLFPAPLRDFLMHLALAGLFRAKWSNEIHEEWIRSVLEQRPDLPRAQLERTRDLMNAYAEDCLVTNYQSLISAVALPDPNDQHVLAAAIRSGADVIVTFNLKHFPATELDKYGIEAQHPDEFLTHLIDLAPHAVCAAAKRQRESLRNPPKSIAEFLDTLERLGLPQTVAGLRQFTELL
jgi:predicted nucleic acid-binding protein